MAHTFEVPLQGDAELVVDKAKQAAGRHGAEFAGDRFAGRFSGNGVKGHYRIAGGAVTVTIDEKPELAPWPMVESAIRGFFEVAGSAGMPAGADAARARRTRADTVVRKHVVWSTGAGLIPIPVADLAAVTAIQVGMLEELTRLYGAEYAESVLKSFVTALTGGMAARLGASALKALPGLGTLIGGVSMSVMSGASTYAVAQVALHQLEARSDLGRVDLEQAKREYKQAFEDGKGFVTSLEKDRSDPQRDPAEDRLARLERLAALRHSGALSEDEFQAEKTKLLAQR